ncbi:MAG: thiolase family protein [Chloroflexi bacterium]|nr:thiolase family protein [Chloroflexota bacterium]
MRRVAVVGVGMVAFGRHPERTLGELGADAVTEALGDASLGWKDARSMFCGVVGGGMTPGTRVGNELGLTGLPIVNIDNASASGSSAFRAAYMDIASGRVDVSIAAGIGKSGRSLGDLRPPASHGTAEYRANLAGWAQGAMPPAGVFALRSRRRMHDFGCTIEQLAMVAVKNRRHASFNPYAQLRKPLTVEEVLAARMIADPLTVPHCCPVGDGAAAAVLMSEDRARALGYGPLVTIEASVFRTPTLAGDTESQDADTTRLTCMEAYAEAGMGPKEIDLVQVHDAFTVEEIEYCESMGFCEVGEGERMVERGEMTIGGKIPFSTDGGLLSRGHPLGPTGLAQVWETVLQLRGQAGNRQVEGARAGLAHMVGVGGVCVIHILRRG